jgi:hypothetical protein
MYWSETPAGILAAGQFPGNDREERARVRAEEQREARVRWEARMDAADHEMAAEGKLDRPWRVVRAAAEERGREWAAEGCAFEVPGSYIQFRPANWINIGRTRPPELEPLFAAMEAAGARVTTTSPQDPGYQEVFAEREAARG